MEMENNIDWIESVKEQGNGYLVNGLMGVPKAEGNGHYRMVQAWLEAGNTPEPEFTQEELDKQALSDAKAQKISDVANITVTTTSGKTFDGDEVAQGRMARAVVSSDVGETTQWILADDTEATVTHEELKEALRLSGEAMTMIWVA